MKKIILILLLLTVTGICQVRGLMIKGNTKTTVDTLNFDFYIWKMTMMVEGNYTDTLYFWFEDKPASANRYFYMIGVDPPISFQFTQSINRLYIRGSSSTIKYRIYALP